MLSRNVADFLGLAENCTFLDRKPISALYESADGHKLIRLTRKIRICLKVTVDISGILSTSRPNVNVVPAASVGYPSEVG
jgi:hypothetical protein